MLDKTLPSFQILNESTVDIWRLFQGAINFQAAATAAKFTTVSSCFGTLV